MTERDPFDPREDEVADVTADAVERDPVPDTSAFGQAAAEPAAPELSLEPFAQAASSPFPAGPSAQATSPELPAGPSAQATSPELPSDPFAQAAANADRTIPAPTAENEVPDAAEHATPAVAFPVPEEVLDYSPEELSPSLAAVCFALNRPLTLGEAAAILGRSQADIALAADHLATTLRGGGLMLQRHQDEIQLVTRPEVAWAVQRALNPEKPGRLSRAALETLAIVAYRQPLTRAGVEAIRGVNCEAVLDSLERRGLIAEVGRQDSPGHPRLFGTTLRFLQVVGLERIEDLPPLPEGLKVPELPAWDIAAEIPDTDADEEPPAERSTTDESLPEAADPQPGDIEVRGAAVAEHGFDADPDEGYGPNGDPGEE